MLDLLPLAGGDLLGALALPLPLAEQALAAGPAGGDADLRSAGLVGATGGGPARRGGRGPRAGPGRRPRPRRAAAAARIASASIRGRGVVLVGIERAAATRVTEVDETVAVVVIEVGARRKDRVGRDVDLEPVDGDRRRSTRRDDGQRGTQGDGYKELSCHCLASRPRPRCPSGLRWCKPPCRAGRQDATDSHPPLQWGTLPVAVPWGVNVWTRAAKESGTESRLAARARWASWRSSWSTIPG